MRGPGLRGQGSSHRAVGPLDLLLSGLPELRRFGVAPEKLGTRVILFRRIIDGVELWGYTPPHRLRSYTTVSPDAPSLLGIEAAPPGLRRRGTLERLE